MHASDFPGDGPSFLHGLQCVSSEKQGPKKSSFPLSLAHKELMSSKPLPWPMRSPWARKKRNQCLINSERPTE